MLFGEAAIGVSQFLALMIERDLMQDPVGNLAGKPQGHETDKEGCGRRDPQDELRVTIGGTQRFRFSKAYNDNQGITRNPAPVEDPNHAVYNAGAHIDANSANAESLKDLPLAPGKQRLPLQRDHWI